MNCIIRSDVPLKEHQVRVVKKLLEPGRHGIAAIHATGSGKTLLSVAASQCYLDINSARNVIVVAPCTLKDNFKKEIGKYKNFHHEDSYLYYTTEKFHKDFNKNPELVNNNTLLIIDEAHTYRTEIKLKGDNPTKGVRSFTILDACRRADKVLLMTATPMVNTISDFINLIGMIDGTLVSDLPTFKTFSNITGNPAYMKSYFAGKLDFYEPSREEYANHFPSVAYTNVFFKMPDALYRIYKKQEELLGFSAAADEDVGDNIFNKDMTKFYTGIRMSSNITSEETQGEDMKITWIIDRVVSTASEGKRWIIFSQFIKYGLAEISKRLKLNNIKHEYITGEVTDLCKRSKAVIDYNSGESNVLLISSCGAAGIDTVNTDFVISLEHPWNYSIQKQVVGRAVRYDSHKNHPTKLVTVYKLYTVKPNEYEYGPELIMQMPGNINPWGELKSSDMLLMGYSEKKSLAIDSLFKSAKTFNSELEANQKQMKERAIDAIDILKDYLFNPKVPIILRSLKPIEKDATVISIPKDWTFVVKIPFIKYPSGPVSTSINIDLGSFSIIGGYSGGSFIISIITEYRNDDGIIFASDIVNIINTLCSKNISRARDTIQDIFFKSSSFVGLLSILSDLPDNEVCSYLTGFMDHGCNINQWTYKINANKCVELEAGYVPYDGFVVYSKDTVILSDYSNLNKVLGDSREYISPLTLKTKNIECLTKESPGYVYKLI